METALTETAEQKSLILPNGPREALLIKLNSFKTNNLNSKELTNYNDLVEKNNCVFIVLCWNKLGISQDQLRQLDTQELDELASLLYERTRVVGVLQTITLAFAPILGWIILLFSLNILYDSTSNYLRRGSMLFWKNMRYFWWYNKIKKISGKNFSPSKG